MFYSQIYQEGVEKFQEWWYRTAKHVHVHTYIHTHICALSLSLSPSILRFLEAPVEGFLWNLLQFGHHIWSDIFLGYETCSPEAIFRVRNKQKSLWVRSRSYDCWVTTGIAAQQAMHNSVHYRSQLLQNKLCTDTSHVHIVGSNDMNRFMRDTNFLLQLCDGNSLIRWK
jgi:hypothetical protein